jgi:hypothetical protein
MDYNLAKIYEAMLQGKELKDLSIRSLSQIYEVSRNPEPAPAPVSTSTSAPASPVSSSPAPAPTSSSGGWNPNNYKDEKFNQVILKHLNVSSIPQHQQYPIETEKDLLLNKADRDVFNKLYPLSDGSKGTGNGEIAAYWLFGGYAETHNNQGGVDGTGERSASAPDLRISSNPSEGLVEIKSYKNLDDISLGKFKDDKGNRYLLSILLGAHVLTSSIKTGFVGKERPVTVDVFNSAEIVKAFSSLTSTFGLLEKLKSDPNTASFFSGVSMLTQLYDTMNHLFDKIKNDKIQQFAAADPTILANSLLRKFAETKLQKKPGFKQGCGIINITKDPSHRIEIISTSGKTLNPEADYISSVSSTSGELKISNLGQLLI